MPPMEEPSAPFVWPTTASGLTWRTRKSCSSHFSACIGRTSFRGSESGWQPCSASCTGTADRSVRLRPQGKGPCFASHCHFRATILRGRFMSVRTLLLVEDNQQDELLTLRALRKVNLANQVEVVRDGQQALDYLFGEGEFADRAGRELPAVV